jgi:hypothetical protein
MNPRQWLPAAMQWAKANPWLVLGTAAVVALWSIALSLRDIEDEIGWLRSEVQDVRYSVDGIERAVRDM